MHSEKYIKNLKGSLTVEACFIVSLTVLVLTALIYCSFYVHDRAVLQGLVCEIAASGSNSLTAKDGQQAAERLKSNIRSSRFLGSRSLKGKAQVGNEKAEASFSGNFPVPGLAMKFFSGNRLALSASWSCEIQNPAADIRKIRGLADLAQDAFG